MLMSGNINLFAQTVGEPAPEFEANLLGGGTFKLKDQYAESGDPVELAKKYGIYTDDIYHLALEVLKR